MRSKFEGEEDRCSKSWREQSATRKHYDWGKNMADKAMILKVWSGFKGFPTLPNMPTWWWFVIIYLARAWISILQACALWETLLRTLDECFSFNEYSNISWNSMLCRLCGAQSSLTTIGWAFCRTCPAQVRQVQIVQPTQIASWHMIANNEICPNRSYSDLARSSEACMFISWQWQKCLDALV